MRPCTSESDISTTWYIIILRMNIKVRHLLDPLPRGVKRHASQVQDAQSQTIVTLVRESVLDELVVVDTLAQTLVVARLLGLLQRGDVPDVGDGVPVGAQAGGVVLVVLVVQDQVLLPLGVEDPALVGVGGAFVGCVGDDADVLLVGYVEALGLLAYASTRRKGEKGEAGERKEKIKGEPTW